MEAYGSASMWGELRRVLVRRPLPEDAAAWEPYGWHAAPDVPAAQAEHEAFCALLEDLGARVEVAPALEGQVDAVYMHDPVIVSARGAIALRMAKPARRAEPEAMVRELERLGVPVLATLEAPAYADGGDRLWLDDSTIALGLGYRTNRAGGRALAELLAPGGVAVEPYDMPHDLGPDSVLHLQSFVSKVTEELAVVYEPPAPVRLLTDLRERGTEWIAIDRDSYLAMGCNVLAVRPGVVVMCDSAPAVRRALEQRGVEVHVYDGSELSLKGDGGPTCLTAPLHRAD